MTPVALAAARIRRLHRLAGPDGIVAGIALDHRDSFRTVLGRAGIDGVSDDDIRRLKLAIGRCLAPAASAVMIDAELGSMVLETAAIPPAVGVIVPLEAQGYETQGDRRLTSLLDDLTPADALAIGADACKLLLPYRVDDVEAADAQDALLRSTVTACHAVGLPLVVEPVVHRRSDETAEAHAAAYPSLVIDAVARLQPLGADLLKLPFPALDSGRRAADPAGDARTADACRTLALACGDTPWVLLGGGADLDTYVGQIRAAGAAGASGFLAGRGIWGPVLRADPAESARLAGDIARPAFERCRDAARAACRPLAPPPGVA
ncbi:MAG TPA: hypothetical protein VFP22_10955 [Candidatus Limnocylindrales bacterium]|nr:hypothetical protein [Candidatus Limnocylindrales bacterium]